MAVERIFPDIRKMLPLTASAMASLRFSSTSSPPLGGPAMNLSIEGVIALKVLIIESSIL